MAVDMQVTGPELVLTGDAPTPAGGARPIAFPLDRLSPLRAGQETATTEPEAPPRRVRYERGSLIYATDGPVGTLRQIVIDEELAEVKALVVKVTARNESILVPPDLVEQSVDGALLLNVTKAQFALGASRSPRMDTKMFSAANLKHVAAIIPLAFSGDGRRSLVSLARDRVETGAALASTLDDPRPAPARAPWWTRFRRTKQPDGRPERASDIDAGVAGAGHGIG